MDQKFSTPIMAGPVSIRAQGVENPDLTYARAVNEAGSVYWSHFHDEKQFNMILEEGISAIRVIKPLANVDDVIKAVIHDEECGAVGYIWIYCKFIRRVDFR